MLNFKFLLEMLIFEVDTILDSILGSILDQVLSLCLLRFLAEISHAHYI